MNKLLELLFYEGNFHMIKEDGALPLKNTNDLKNFLQSPSVMKAGQSCI